MSVISIIPQSDDKLFFYLWTETGKYIFGWGNKTDQEDRETKIAVIVLGLITVSATEPFKVILRKNIGKLSLSLGRLLFACALYLVWAFLLFSFSQKSEEYATAFMAGSILYIFLAFGISALGIVEYNKGTAKYEADQHLANMMQHIDRGESVFINPFVSTKWNQTKIWLIAEPLLCFIIGLLLTFLPALYNPSLALIGAPILVTSLAFWFNEWFQITNVWNVVGKKIGNAREGRNRPDENNFSDDVLI